MPFVPAPPRPMAEGSLAMTPTEAWRALSPSPRFRSASCPLPSNCRPIFAGWPPQPIPAPHLGCRGCCRRAPCRSYATLNCGSTPMSSRLRCHSMLPRALSIVCPCKSGANSARNSPPMWPAAAVKTRFRAPLLARAMPPVISLLSPFWWPPVAGWPSKTLTQLTPYGKHCNSWAPLAMKSS